MVLNPPSMYALFLFCFLGITPTLQHCPVWKEIVPCTCKMDAVIKLMSVYCDKMESFEHVLEKLRGHFQPTDKVSLKLSFSSLSDLYKHSFNELNVTIEDLKLNHDVIGYMNPETFRSLTRVNYLSLADNDLEEVPEKLWTEMPNIKTLDLGRTKIKTLLESSFAGLKHIECLVLPGNQIAEMHPKSIPSQIQRLHLGRNHINNLNNTLRNLSELRWLFINSNQLVDIDGQLPRYAPNLILIHASHNQLDKLPQQLRNYQYLESIFLHNNRLTSLDGALAKSSHLQRAVLEHNHINTLTKEDFAETSMLESLLLGHNELSTLNNSLLKLTKLNFLNLTFNKLQEFSLQEIVNLKDLRSIDLSYNSITTLIGPPANLVDWNIRLTELKLDHNYIEILNGALSGLTELLRLNLSFNKLRKISPEDFIGLEELRLLDISYNYLTTLEETSKTYLPRLSELKASHNQLTILEKDFHGLPVLCHADLSNNRIIALGRDLVAKTRCTLEHGIHEGTWDTLKLYLQDNPILCDAALPDIVSIMETNHTKIIGVSHCPPLSEQPTTSKPNAFLGYIPETTNSQKYSTIERNKDEYQNEEQSNHEQKNDIQTIQSDAALDSKLHYSIQNDPSIMDEPFKEDILLNVQHPPQKDQRFNPFKRLNDTLAQAEIKSELSQQTSLFDPVKQGQQINKLASQIEELRSRIDELTSQNKMLMNQQFNKNDNLSELQKP
ncbi:insulin-like growth factor-binding protein complex acid labile subunit [Diorhabda sublineata]|uniref:insulin-like growth factor-binding protein complex acid labile subunit n=1 Tax=Diorhabda sublineata TaxID=1163346 RepID=UPI0024E16ED0|nr:insulin-like growth factor-binding protein complex acid labile subunit [Diorhabda sublineata]